MICDFLTFCQDSPHYGEVQRVLREEVVNPLRRHGYVRADRVMKLRTLLERLSDVPGLTTEEKVYFVPLLLSSSQVLSNNLKPMRQSSKKTTKV